MIGIKKIMVIGFLSQLLSCENINQNTENNQAIAIKDPELVYPRYQAQENDLRISREAYLDKMEGFWLSQLIANWTGLVTELDKEKPPFYTDEDWGSIDHPNMWGSYVPHTDVIDFYFVKGNEPWGADDDTDIEYIYQHLLDIHNTSLLSPEQIREGWLKHIYTNDDAPFYQKFPEHTPKRENFLWESNDTALALMQKGMTPPATSEPENNPKYASIDAQLTTEIFGLFAPCRPDLALKMAHLPIRTTAKNESEWISEFYVIMHSLASCTDKSQSMKHQTQWLADKAREHLPKGSYPAAMFDFIKSHYQNNPDKNDWEQTRDAVYEKFQKRGESSYQYKLAFDAGINFAASLVSLFYGEGDIIKTVKIGTLTGWDSDNPTATWGGLLGFMLGKKAIKEIYQQKDLSNTFWIHRTRRNFPDRTPNRAGEDAFDLMAERAIVIIDRVVLEEMKGGVSFEENVWFIPPPNH